MSLKLHRQAPSGVRQRVRGRTPDPRSGGFVSRSGEFWVELVRDRADLEALVPEWEVLAQSAAEPNVFYEPLMALPALEHLSKGKQIEFVLVYGTACCKGVKNPVLCGFFPLDRTRLFNRFSTGYIKLWDYIHCFLRTPLVHKDCASEVLATFLGWLASEPSNRLMKFGQIGADGQFYKALTAELHRRQLPMWVSQNYMRATMTRCGDADGYLASAISSKRMGEYRRQSRRLKDRGVLEFRRLSENMDIETWLGDFLYIEGSGWKGEEGTAMTSNSNDRAFFEEAARKAFVNNKLQMFAAYLDGKVIAQKCNFISGNSVFGFKIAFDESLKRYSPGVLLELENVRYFQNHAQLVSMDSCADPDHPMIDHIWSGRRNIQSILIGAARGRGDFIVAIAPFGRWLKRRISALLPVFKTGK